MFHGLQHIFGVAVSRIHRNHVHSRPHQHLHSFLIVRSDSNRRADSQPAMLVFASKRILSLLLNIFDGNQPFEPKIIIHKQEFFDPMAVESFLCLIEIDSRSGRNQFLFCHHLEYRSVQSLFKPEIPMRQDPY